MSSTDPPRPCTMTSAARASPGGAPHTKMGWSRCGSLAMHPRVAQRREHGFDPRARRLEPRRELEPGAEVGQRVIYGETGRISCGLEQHAARLPVVDGPGILAV